MLSTIHGPRWFYSPPNWESFTSRIFHRLNRMPLQCVAANFSMYFSKNILHYDVIKWKHFQRYWTLVKGNHWSPMASPQKGQWRGVLMFPLICKRMSKQSRRRWFDTSSRSLWRHCNVVIVGWGISYVFTIRWMSDDLIVSTSSARVMAWCCHAPFH